MDKFPYLENTFVMEVTEIYPTLNLQCYNFWYLINL